MTIRRILWWTLTVVLALLTVTTTAFGTWQLIRASQPTPADSIQARQTVLDVAKTSTVKLLSYSPDNVESQLTSAATLTTGAFHDSYTRLIEDVVIPGAKEKTITATAVVPAVAVGSLTGTTATMIVFINQTVTVGSATPEDTASSVRMRLENVEGTWLIAAFDPV